MSSKPEVKRMADYEEDFDKEELIDECIEYVEGMIQEYIDEKLEEILIELLDEKYDSNLIEFIKSANKDHVDDKYEEILKEDGYGYIIDFCNDKNIDSDEIDDIVFNMLIEYKEDFVEKLYDDLLKFADENIDDPKINMYFTSYQLKELDDKVGDRITNYIDRDYDNREKCFIDIDGTILVSEEKETHAQLVNKYLENLEKETRKETFYRPDNEDKRIR